MTKPIDIFLDALLAEINRRDVKVVIDEVNQEGNTIRGSFTPLFQKGYFAFKLDDFRPEILKVAAERAGHLIENKVHPERVEKMMLEAAMEIINLDKNDGDSEKDDEV